jgi:hypothetical protein
MKVFDRLKKRILDEFGYGIVDIQRTYAGRNLKAAGAFTWFGWVEINGERTHKRIGSSWPASELIKKKYRLVIDDSWGDLDIIPEER